MNYSTWLFPVDFGQEGDCDTTMAAEAVYDTTSTGELVPIAFFQTQNYIKLAHVPFGKTYVKYKKV